MKRYLERLRTKPDHIKRRIAFFTSTSVSLLILAVWIVSASVSTGTASVQADAQGTEGGRLVVESPITSLTASAGDALGSFLKSISNFFGEKKVDILNEVPVDVIPGKI